MRVVFQKIFNFHISVLVNNKKKSRNLKDMKILKYQKSEEFHFDDSLMGWDTR